MMTPEVREKIKAATSQMIADGADEATINDFLAKTKAKYGRPDSPPLQPGHGMGDVKMAESPDGIQRANDAYKKQLLKDTWDKSMVGTAARTLGALGQSISTGPINAIAQGIQDADGAGSAAWNIAKNEVKNLANPVRQFFAPGESGVQSTETSLERAGVPNTPRTSTAYPATAGLDFPAGMNPYGMDNTEVPGVAASMGGMIDAVSPAYGIEAVKAAGSVGKSALSELKRGILNSQGMRTAAEKSILDNYAPRLRAEFAPPEPTPGILKNASSDLANTLKESDLLHPPEKAKINLNAGLEKIGGAINRTIQQAKDVDVVINAQDVVNNYASTTRALLKRTGKGAAEIEDIEGKILPKIQKIVENLGPDELGNIPVDRAVEFRRALQSMVKNWGEDNKNLAQIVAKKLSSSMNEKITASHPVFGPRLAKLNDKYAALKDAEPMIDEGYAKAYAKATGVKVNDRGVPLTKQGVIDRTLEKVLNPRESLMKMNPELAQRIANDRYLPTGSSSPLPEYIARPSTVTEEELQALRAPFVQNDLTPIGPGMLPPREPRGRVALNKPETYVPQEGSIESPWGKPSTQTEEFDPMASMYPDARNPAQDAAQEGLPGYEGMMSPEDQAEKARRAMEEREALARQDRPVRVSQTKETPGGVEIVDRSDVRLPPRRPKGEVESNFPTRIPENPKIAAVLDKTGRRSLGPTPIDPDAFLKVLDDADGWPPGLNEKKITQLVNAYKKTKPDAVKAKIMNLLRQEWERAATLDQAKKRGR